MEITFASLTTNAGAIAAAAVVTLLIEVIKTSFPVLDARVSGAAMAFVLTALLYIGAVAALQPLGPDSILTLGISWITCAAAAVGIKSAVSHVTTKSDPESVDAVPID